MAAWQQLCNLSWDWEPSIIIGCAGLLVGYGAALRWRFEKRAGFFFTGVLILLIALVSPLDTLADTYLFSAHMVQHLVLLFAVPMLLLAGMPAGLTRQLLSYPPARRLERILSKPAVAWTIGVGTLWIWHWPLLYNAALASEELHVMEHLCFLVTATIFWWPVMAPLKELQLIRFPRLLYLYTASIANALLGIILAVVPTILYPAYLHPADRFGILPILREQWGITPRVDQRIGGILMWAPVTVVYLVFIYASLVGWAGTPTQKKRSPLTPTDIPGRV